MEKIEVIFSNALGLLNFLVRGILHITMLIYLEDLSLFLRVSLFYDIGNMYFFIIYFAPFCARSCLVSSSVVFFFGSILNLPNSQNRIRKDSKRIIQQKMLIMSKRKEKG